MPDLLQSLEDILIAAGKPVPATARCASCLRDTAAFALYPDETGRPVCGSCRIAAEREQAPPYQVTMDDVRAERNNRLAETDWWMRPDVVAQTLRSLYAKRVAYCRALRDFPDTVADPAALPPWPESPG